MQAWREIEIIWPCHWKGQSLHWKIGHNMAEWLPGLHSPAAWLLIGGIYVITALPWALINLVKLSLRIANKG